MEEDVEDDNSWREEEEEVEGRGAEAGPREAEEDARATVETAKGRKGIDEGATGWRCLLIREGKCEGGNLGGERFARQSENSTSYVEEAWSWRPTELAGITTKCSSQLFLFAETSVLSTVASSLARPRSQS